VHCCAGVFIVFYVYALCIVTVVLLLYLAIWATISLNTLHFTRPYACDCMYTQSNAPRPCTAETQGLLYFDLSSSNMYRCAERQWRPWDWDHRPVDATSTRGAAARRQQSSVRRAASTPDSSPAQPRTCPPGRPVRDHLLPVSTARGIGRGGVGGPDPVKLCRGGQSMF